MSGSGARIGTAITQVTYRATLRAQKAAPTGSSAGVVGTSVHITVASPTAAASSPDSGTTTSVSASPGPLNSWFFSSSAQDRFILYERSEVPLVGLVHQSDFFDEASLHVGAVCKPPLQKKTAFLCGNMGKVVLQLLRIYGSRTSLFSGRGDLQIAPTEKNVHSMREYAFWLAALSFCLPSFCGFDVTQ